MVRTFVKSGAGDGASPAALQSRRLTGRVPARPPDANKQKHANFKRLGVSRVRVPVTLASESPMPGASETT